ncbi:cytochrome c oxidase subunit 3 family protein [Pigmentiphaga soli]|uniref:Cytochrome c oxidase subunit 3 family protein n=1 Tax=Pigmentiphaga soli TaxID=1007095 RepID=A0ABP8H4P0_9BURK
MDAASSAADRLADYRARLGMWVFLATEAMFIGPLFLVYATARLRLPEAFEQAGRLADVALGATNTAVLLTSSLAMALAVEAARLRLTAAARRALAATLALGALFLVLKGCEYALDWREHLFPGAGFRPEGVSDVAGARLFFLLYFTATGIHAIHVAVGLGAIAAALRRWRRRPDDHAVRQMEATGLYWHFVDVVWIFLFPALYLVGRAP